MITTDHTLGELARTISHAGAAFEQVPGDS